MRNLFKNILLILLIFISVSALFSLFFNPLDQQEEISITQLANDINQEKIREIKVSGNSVEVVYKDDSTAVSQKETEDSLSQSLINYGVNRNSLSAVKVGIIEQDDDWSWLGPVLLSILPCDRMSFSFSCMSLSFVTMTPPSPMVMTLF